MDNDRRYSPRPLLGAGALIFRPTDSGIDEILLVQRGKQPYKGSWALPGGLVEVGEKLEAAVVREVLEETGLTVRPLYLGELFERIMPDAEGRIEYHYVLADYVCEIVSGEPVAADDAGAVTWLRLDALDSLPLTPATKEVVLRVAAKRTCC